MRCLYSFQFKRTQKDGIESSFKSNKKLGCILSSICTPTFYSISKALNVVLLGAIELERVYMSASNFNLRGIPTEIMALLKREAKRLHISVNVLILKMIERGLGFNCRKPAYHDLDHLAGSWSAAEEKAFEENTEYFEKIDKELWS